MRRSSVPNRGAGQRPQVAPPGKAAAKPATAAKAAKAAAKTVTPKAAKPARRPSAAPARSLNRAANQASRAAERQDRKAAKTELRERMAQVRRFTGKSRLRTGIIIATVGSLLALGGLVLATIYTPIMAINKIEIVGLHRMKQATVYNAVKTLIGTPLTTVDENQIEARLANFTLIQSFTTVALPPHTLQIYVQERQPIGIVTIGVTDYLYDPAGVQIGPAANRASRPLILVNGDPSNSPNFREAVSVLLALPVDLYPKVASIQATSIDDVRIKLRGIANRQIIWGDSSDSVLKSRVLSALMANSKRGQSAVFDVSSPTAPTVRYGSY